MIHTIKKWYVNFLEKEEKTGLEVLFYLFLVILSFVYGIIVVIRNFLYDLKIIRATKVKNKVIGIGNLSWAGSGKTTLAMHLYQKLCGEFKTAILRRGYGDDEGRLIEEKTQDVFSSPDRARLAKTKSSSFELFMLDDGLQYRRLKKDLEIVVMGARELKKPYRLIPASFFREPLSALKRVRVLVLNYADEIENSEAQKRRLQEKFSHLKIYLARYTLKRFVDLEGNEYKREDLINKRVAALAAIGYPQGFFNKLKELGINPTRKIVYPDHYQLSKDEFCTLEYELLDEGMGELIITSKDKYHIPQNINAKIKIIVMEIEIEIDEEKEFLQTIKTYLK
ncbi:MAG: tetraacyldisaccharide 4'-kinase [Candidatus Omnitrophota bacterium]|nr:MAG: tetraacyldisaccharide 4'-kinase [Candidatus Omnitrophota bacterium]